MITLLVFVRLFQLWTSETQGDNADTAADGES